MLGISILNRILKSFNLFISCFIKNEAKDEKLVEVSNGQQKEDSTCEDKEETRKFSEEEQWNTEEREQGKIKDEKQRKQEEKERKQKENEWKQEEDLQNFIRYKPPSLVNAGATCYLNSAFQGISACDIFVKDISDISDDKQNKELHKLHFFKELLDILNECSKNRMEISRNPIFQHWNKRGQQDSYELLAYALNEVYNELRKHKELTKEIAKKDLNMWLKQKLPMRYILKYKIICGTCSMQSSSPLQSDLAFHVTIPKSENHFQLDYLFDLFFKEDPIEGYECDKKGCTGNDTKRIARLCKPFPKTICIHLQRTYWNGYSMKKINKKVEFNNTLTIKSDYQLKKSDETLLLNIELNNTLENESQIINVKEDLNTNLNEEDSVVLFIQTFVKQIIHSAILEMECENLKNESLSGIVEEINGIQNNVGKDVNLKGNDCSEEITKDHNAIEDDKGDDEINTVKVSKCESVEDIRMNMVIQDCDCKTELNMIAHDHDECNIRESIEEVIQEEKNEIYSLVSVIEHSGSVGGGHYICYKKVGSNWFLTNDSFVQKVSESVVFNCQAYILFFESSSFPIGN